MARRRIKPDNRTRTCRLELPPEERDLLRTLATQLGEALRATEGGEGSGAMRRLFPRAYVTDDEAEANYSAATQPALTAAQLGALDTVVETVGASALTEEQMGEWMAALTDLRLVLGTLLGVSDHEPLEEFDASATNASETLIYHYLTMLQSELIDVMEQWLPEPVPGADDAAPDDPWGDPLGGLRWDGTPQPEWPPRPEW